MKTMMWQKKLENHLDDFFSKILNKSSTIKNVAIIISLLIIFVVVFMRPSLELKSKLVTIDGSLHSSESSLAHKKSTGGNHLKGMDVSHFQGSIDWEIVAKQDIQFVYIKATDGTTFIDPRFKYNQESLINNSILFGAYHFFEPDEDGIKQANNFLAQVKIHDNMLPPVLDVEIIKGVNKEKFKKHVRKWIDTVEHMTGCQPIIYSYSDFYTEYLGDDFSQYRLWLADYAKKPTLPNGIEQWFVWQHSQSGKVKGVSSMVDKDLFLGNKGKLTTMKCKGKV